MGNIDIVPFGTCFDVNGIARIDIELHCCGASIASVTYLEVAVTGYVQEVGVSWTHGSEVNDIAFFVSLCQSYVIECLAAEAFLDYYLLSYLVFDDSSSEIRVRREAVNLSSGRRCVGLTGYDVSSASAVGAGVVEAEYHLTISGGFEHCVINTGSGNYGTRVAVRSSCLAVNHVSAVGADDSFLADIAQRGVGSGEHTVHICAAVELIFEPCFLVGEHCVFLAGNYLDSLQAVLVGLVGSRLEERGNVELQGTDDVEFDVQSGIAAEHAVGDAAAVGLLSDSDVARFRTDDCTTSDGVVATLKSCELNASRSAVGVVGLDHEVLSVEGCQQLVNVDTVPVVAFEDRERLVGGNRQLYC